MSQTIQDLDAAVRSASFTYVHEQSAIYGEALPRQALAEGFTFQGRRVPLVGPQGIFKPAVLPEMPLSITTSPIVPGKERRYEDDVTADGYIVYRYRGTDAQHPDNVGLRLAMERGVPLIHFEGVDRGLYFPRWPVYVVGDDPTSLSFYILADDPAVRSIELITGEVSDQTRRKYVTHLTVVRLHQARFRVRVIRAYDQACSVCRLRHLELLDAAHILPDGHPKGAPVVPNGLALCKLHHAAMDANIMGVRPDLTLEVRRDVLNETDGPMLLHGLQGVAGERLISPRRPADRPNPEFLEERYEQFLKVS